MSRKKYRVEIEFDPHKYMEGKKRRRDRRRRDDLLATARSMALEHALRHSLGLCTVDDVYAELRRTGHPPAELGSVAGAIFRSPGWEPLPWRVRRRRPSGHPRLIRIWRHTGDPGPSWIRDPAG